MNRVSHGTKNAVTYLPPSLTAIISEYLKHNIVIWLDDVLVHAETVIQLQDYIAAFIKLCVEYNIKLHPAK